MDRIINVKVRGSHLSKDSRKAGVQHEGNAKKLRIEFDEGWDGYAKKVTFWDAKGQNPVERTLTADLLEDITESIRIYLCPIPGEAMTESGMCTFVVDGYANGVRQRSLSAELEVAEAPFIEEADQPVDPTPTQAEQLQVQIDTILDDMQAEAIRAETAADNAEKAQTAAETAQAGAEAAQTAAETAQGKAEQAQAAAENAQEAAETAKAAAENAQTAAENAQEAAEEAEETAVEHAVMASQAKNDAQEAAKSAGNLAYIAASMAEQAADSAEEAKQAAGNAAQQAYTDTKALMEGYVSDAQESAQAAATSESNAEKYADSVNPDEINSRIAAKGDNLEFDTEEGLLYLTSGGERIGDGIKVATSGGGGGGGGESNNAVLTLTNTTGWIYKTISQGAPAPVAFNWSSLENGMATGAGVLKITVGGTTKHTAQIAQGEHSLDISAYLSAGSNNVKLNVTDVYGNSRSLSFNLTVVSLVLESSFDSSVAYTGDIAFPYTPTAAVEKTMYFLVDGNEIGTATVTASGRQQTFTIPALSHGAHTLEAYFTANIDGEDVESNHLYYAIIATEEGNNTPIIAVDWRQDTAEQFDTLSIRYMVYDPASLTATVGLYSDETGETTELTVDRTKQTWSYRVETAGEVTLGIACLGADTSTGEPLTAAVFINLTVTETSLDVAAETNDLALYLTSYGRSNNETNPSQWSYGDVEASLTGFNFTSDGWMEDEDGITVLRVGGDARVEIPVHLFAKDFRTTGKTIEIEFASRNVLDYDAVIADCWMPFNGFWEGGRGLQITAQQAMLRSEQSEVATRYKEDDHLRLSFVIEKRSGNRLILGYVNGIISGMVQYPDDDDFSQSAPVNITLGSNQCTIDIYNIRVYDNDLTRFQMLDNWIADTQDLGEKKDRYDRNNIFDEYGQILPTTLRPHQCYLIINCPVLPTYKGDKKTCSGQYVDPVHPERCFTFSGAQIDVQGTSSQYYYVKNFKIKFKNGFVQNGKINATYAMNANAVPTNEFTFKADVASSEGANNVVLAELYNDLCPVKTPAQEADPRVRQTIEGHPIVVFHNNGSGAKFIGKYNFNNDKGTAEVFGFTTGDESWEIKENGNAQVSFKTDDFTNWQTSFEARYPEDNTNITKLQQFVAWVASTNTEGQTDEEKAARLAKFKEELPDWADVDDAIFYYLFTLVFLCIDQREKNAFPTWNAAMAKWLWLFYDADSSIGTDNKGNLTFEYWMEDIDFTEAGDPVFNGQNNVFWSNLRECFGEEIKAEYRRLRTDLGADGKALLSYDKVNDLFTAHQSQWSEAIYNEDAWRKAVEPLEKNKDTQYLAMQQGKKEQHFKHWMYNRFRYLDSWAETGAALDEENRIMMRAHAQGNIWLTSYINMYGQVYYNSERAENRMVRDQAYEFEWKAEGAEDAVIGVNSAPMITSLGDLSPLMLEYCHIQYAKHLTELKVGDGAADYVNDNFVALTLGNNVLLKKLDVRNCTSLTQSVDASGCTNIEEVYFDGSSITGLSLPNGGNLKKLHLPETITNLTLRNQTKLEEFVLPGYGNITTLRLENVASVVPMAEILAAVPANSRVRLIGFDWTYDSEEDLLAFYNRLNTMRGLDENGNNVDTAQMSGTIHIDSIDSGLLYQMQQRYPSITIVYNTIITYTVRFYNGSTLLQTVESVGYGDSVEYTGEEPSNGEKYTFTGWDPAPSFVTGDMDCYAVFLYSGKISRDLIDRSLSGRYANDRVTSIGMRAFRGCTALVSVNFAAATSIAIEGFRGCAALRSADFAAVTSIAGETFIDCYRLGALILRSGTMCTLSYVNAFSGTPIASGTGYIYVPAALLEDYKVATNWSTYAAQFRALEDYPDVTGGEIA